MPTPSHDPESSLPLLPDDLFELLRELPKDRFEQLSTETREAFDRTSAWHFGQRQKIDLEDIWVGGVPFGEWKAKHLEDDSSGPEGQA